MKKYSCLQYFIEKITIRLSENHKTEKFALSVYSLCVEGYLVTDSTVSNRFRVHRAVDLKNRAIGFGPLYTSGIVV